MKNLFILTLILFPLICHAVESTCYGTTSNGRLENGVKLPSNGNNYEGYSYIAETLGRTYVHSKVKTVIVDAYKYLETELPEKVYKYAETGFQDGGQFKPHKTHRNGLSVDFMTPVINVEGESVHLPTHPFNKFGYNIEFDGNDRYEEYRIDFLALAAHIVALDIVAKRNGIGIWRVIFDPKLQPKLLATRYGDYIAKNISLSKKRSWVRHDEHYHVDFDVKCK